MDNLKFIYSAKHIIPCDYIKKALFDSFMCSYIAENPDELIHNDGSNNKAYALNLNKLLESDMFEKYVLDSETKNLLKEFIFAAIIDDDEDAERAVDLILSENDLYKKFVKALCVTSLSNEIMHTDNKLFEISGEPVISVEYKTLLYTGNNYATIPLIYVSLCETHDITEIDTKMKILSANIDSIITTIFDTDSIAAQISYDCINL